MIDDGLFTQFPVDAVFGVHNWPGMPAGQFGVTEGPIMAPAMNFALKSKA
jgi:Metal-dependent amidase/aminoacylase/carboxypeptidase